MQMGTNHGDILKVTSRTWHSCSSKYIDFLLSYWITIIIILLFYVQLSLRSSVYNFFLKADDKLWTVRMLNTILHWNSWHKSF